MPTIQRLEGYIAAREGFDVRFRFAGPGRSRDKDVRSDKRELGGYPFERKAPSNKTVAWWIETRFASLYPGYTVDVLDGRGRPVHGGTKLATVRASYG